MAKRKQSAAPVSLFSFQDIITSICGIIVLLVLLFAIEMARQEPRPDAEAGQASRAEEVSRLEEEVRSAQRTLDALKQSEIAQSAYAYWQSLQRERDKRKVELGYETKKTAARTVTRDDLTVKRDALLAQLAKQAEVEVVRFIPGEGSKKPVLVECSSSAISVKGENPQSYPANDRNAVLRAFSTRFDANTECLVLMLKPSSIEYANGFIQSLQKSGLTVGWDALEEHAQTQLAP